MTTSKQGSPPSKDSETTVSDLDYLNALADNADRDIIASYEKAKLAIAAHPPYQINENPIREPGIWRVMKYGVSNSYGGELPDKPLLIDRSRFSIPDPYQSLETRIRYNITYNQYTYRSDYFNIGPKDGFTSHAEAEKWLKTYLKGPNTTCYEADGKKVACV